MAESGKLDSLGPFAPVLWDKRWIAGQLQDYRVFDCQTL
jgi:hypothetical protein